MPPGFERVYRDGIRMWFREWLSVLDIDSSAAGRLLQPDRHNAAHRLGGDVDDVRDAGRGRTVIEAAIALINRLTGWATSSGTS